MVSTPCPEDSPVYSVGGARHYLAFRLRYIRTLTALGVQMDQYSSDYYRRQVEFLSSLVNPRDERLTYDLRFLSQPDPIVSTRGRITVVLLCRMDGFGARDAHGHARDLLHLLEALFDEYGFELAGAREVRRHLKPFPLRHLVTITRRAELQRLDTLRSSRPRARPGFTAAEAANPEPAFPPDAVFHLFPHLPPSTSFNNFFKLLLLHPAPVAISVRLRPTALALEEEAFLEEQIARCERYAQIGLEPYPPQDTSTLRPALREQARLYQQYQAGLLSGLKGNAALIGLEVASPKPIPTLLADTLGALVAGAAGRACGAFEGAPQRYLAGGYETVDRSGDIQASRAFGELEFFLAPHPLAPPGAGRLLYLFDAVEASAVFRLPPATVEAMPGFNVHSWRSQPPPQDLRQEGVLLGVSVHGRTAQPVRIGPDDRARHVYVVGQTGTGKTTLLRTMILDDMRGGRGLCLIDPHGDLFKELLGKVPEERIGDVVLLDPTDVEYPVGLNMLEYETESQRHFLIQELVGIIARLLEDEYGAGAAGQFAGPLFFQHMRMNLLLAMSDPTDPGTLLEFYTIYQERDYWRRWLPPKVSDPLLERWVTHVLPRTDYTRPGGDGVSMGGYVGSKFENFVFDPLLRRIFGQKRSTIDLRAIMDQGKIFLVNLAKGELTEENARFLGMVLLAKLMAAAMGRVTIPKRERREFHLYVDEFQSLATQSFVTLLSEARKFGLSLVLANQFLSQVRDPRIVLAIFGNVGTVVCFRLGQADAELMEREFFPVFNRFDLANLPNWQAYMTSLVDGQTVRPFNMQTLPDTTPFEPARERRVRDESRRTFGRLRGAVEEEIAHSLRWPSSAEPQEGDEEEQDR